MGLNLPQSEQPEDQGQGTGKAKGKGKGRRRQPSPAEKQVEEQIKDGLIQIPEGGMRIPAGTPGISVDSQNNILLTNADAVMLTVRALELIAEGDFNLERTDARDALSRALFRKGADDDGIAFATGSLYHEGWGKNTRSFYESFGLRSGQRKNLPPATLRILVFFELSAWIRVDNHIVVAESQVDINYELGGQVRLAVRAAKRLMYWLKFGEGEINRLPSDREERLYNDSPES